MYIMRTAVISPSGGPEKFSESVANKQTTRCPGCGIHQNHLRLIDYAGHLFVHIYPTHVI